LDLLSCIECGLCTYVCILRIPIFQYIMLGKQEIARRGTGGGAHA
jgi:electron transport complex protein RnfC